MSTIQGSNNSTALQSSTPLASSTASTPSTSTNFNAGTNNLLSNPVFMQLLKLLIQLLRSIQSGSTSSSTGSTTSESTSGSSTSTSSTTGSTSSTTSGSTSSSTSSGTGSSTTPATGSTTSGGSSTGTTSSTSGTSSGSTSSSTSGSTTSTTTPSTGSSTSTGSTTSSTSGGTTSTTPSTGTSTSTSSTTPSTSSTSGSSNSGSTTSTTTPSTGTSTSTGSSVGSPTGSSTSTGTGSSSSTTSTAPATPEPLKPTAFEQIILNNLFATNENGIRVNGASVTVYDGATPDDKLSTGDKVVVHDANNKVIRTKVLTAADMYEIQFRKNYTDVVQQVESGWTFDSLLVKILGGTLPRPETRSYTDKGREGTEVVLERNKYWEVVQRDGNPRRLMLMRTADDNEQAIKPSDAINDIFKNRSQYAFDCATPMPLFNLKATLDTVGADTFNRYNKDKLILSSWYNPFESYNGNVSNGGYNAQARFANAGEITLNNHSNLASELARFDPTQGDNLIIGNVYYFEKPGDETSAYQGWNAIYMGPKDGAHQFWFTGYGMQQIKFNEDGSWVPTNDLFKNYYLGASVANPNFTVAQGWLTPATTITV